MDEFLSRRFAEIVVRIHGQMNASIQIWTQVAIIVAVRGDARCA
jgi:hypothetical protein